MFRLFGESMGPLFVLIFWAVGAVVLSTIGGTILRGVVAFLHRNTKGEKKKALLIACLQ